MARRAPKNDIRVSATDALEFEPKERPRRGLPTTVWLLIVLILVTSAGMGGLLFGGMLDGIQAPETEETPMVHAAPGPIKVRPANPGGVPIPNRNIEVYERMKGEGAETRVESLLPSAEQPLTRPQSPPVPEASATQTAPAQAPQTVEQVAAAPALPDTATATPAPPPVPQPTQPITAPQAALQTVPQTQPAPAQAEQLLPPAAPTPSPAAAPAAEVVAVTPEPAPVPAPTTAPAVAPAATPAPPPAAPPRVSEVTPNAPRQLTPSPLPPSVKQRTTVQPPVASATPVPAPAPAAPATTQAPQTARATPAVPAAALGRGWTVQLAASRSEASARAEGQRLQRKFTRDLGKLSLAVVRADLGPTKGVFYRIRLGPLSTQNEARAVCGSLSKQNQGCLVIAPGK